MPQSDMPELFRVQPDTPPEPPIDIGVHSWPVGSYAPMAFYRPTPIVHFTRAVVGQLALNYLLYAVLLTTPSIVSAVAYAIVALVLTLRAFPRWLAQASTTWKIVTLTALALNLALFAFASLTRSCNGLSNRDWDPTTLAFSAAGEPCPPNDLEPAFRYDEDIP